MGAKSSLLRRWRNSSWQNVFTVVHAAFPYIPLSAQSNQMEEEPACYTLLHMADDTPEQSRAERHWPMGSAPRFPGLTYHPGHCDDCSFFSPKCSETCDSGWLASACGWVLQAWCRSNYIRFLRRMDLWQGEERFLNSEHGIKNLCALTTG